MSFDLVMRIGYKWQEIGLRKVVAPASNAFSIPQPAIPFLLNTV
jgi:hypothetical protein